MAKIMSKKEFIAYIAPIIVADSNKRNLLPSPRIAQAIHESGYGTSELAQKANALFGVKDNDQWDGKVYNKVTGEFYDSQYTEISANFQAYDSWEDSVYWQGWYLENRKYSPESKTTVYAKLKGVRDYKEFCHLLKSCGYATGPNYAENLIEHIEENNLTQYDVETIPVAPDNDVPVGRLALSVGHSILKSGACTSADGRGYGGVLEYAYNKSLAPLVKSWMEKAGWECDIIINPEHKYVKAAEEKNYKLPIVNDPKADYDLVCELHLNASRFHNATGTEVLYVSQAGKKYAERISDKLSTMIKKHGSGIVYRNNLYMLTKTKPVSVMIEAFFCDNANDCKLMENQHKVAKLIAEGIVGHEISDSAPTPVVPQPTPVDPDPGTDEEKKESNNTIRYWIQCGAFGVKDNATRRVNALKIAGIDSFIKSIDGLNVVQAGAFTTREAAEKHQRLIESKGFKTILRDKESDN